MNFVLVLPVALALAMDAFAVAVGLSVAPQGLSRTQAFRLSFFFGSFQFMMPLVGWVAGKGFFRYIRDVDHWVAFGLLLFVGGKMVLTSFQDEKMRKETANDPTKGLNLIMLSVATSIDAFAVGLSFAALQEGILYPSIVIGFVAFFLTLGGTRLGPLVGKLAGKGAEFLGGLILILIGIKILADHL
jgi:putative Mn2+ efflux pump MntP